MRKIDKIDGRPIVEAADVSVHAWLRSITFNFGVANGLSLSRLLFSGQAPQRGVLGQHREPRDLLEVRALIRAFLIPTWGLGSRRRERTSRDQAETNRVALPFQHMGFHVKLTRRTAAGSTSG